MSGRYLPVWIIQNKLTCGNILVLIYGAFYFFILKMNLNNNGMNVDTGNGKVMLSNILVVDKLGPLSFMFNLIQYTIYILVVHTISCAVHCLSNIIKDRIPFENILHYIEKLWV
jgi:hypothetical protein